ncbi:unnamed protein product [Darwinula stevensoni]|uniref:Uncharacterized protein n=1 Tax=Darwinula stevensoni TaxID=69355 RepID=A0A7R9A063_9CRUS|nr:unnamed protein product [Darwinula stevensoni]CAG0880360.1 unnamed protein product [Darwinula stevensoni]
MNAVAKQSHPLGGPSRNCVCSSVSTLALLTMRPSRQKREERDVEGQKQNRCLERGGDTDQDLELRHQSLTDRL